MYLYEYQKCYTKIIIYMGYPNNFFLIIILWYRKFVLHTVMFNTPPHFAVLYRVHWDLTRASLERDPPVECACKVERRCASRRRVSLKFSRGWRRPRYTMARLPHHTMPFLTRGRKKHRVLPTSKGVWDDGTSSCRQHHCSSKSCHYFDITM